MRINKIIHRITCKHAPPGGVILYTLVQPTADEGCLHALREDGPDAGEDAAPVLCRRQHTKALPGCHREERWAVSRPQRGITCMKAFSHHAMESAHREDNRGLAEAARTRFAGSPTVRSGSDDAQSPLNCSANRNSRQRISSELQIKPLKWKRQGRSSRTTKPGCTKEGGGKDRREVHEVAE